MCKIRRVELFGDSVGRGVYYDPASGRYLLGKETYVAELKRRGYAVGDHTMIGATVKRGEALVDRVDMGSDTLAVVEYGGNDCDLDWKAVSRDPDGAHLPRVSPEEFRAGIRHMVDAIRAKGARALVVVPVPVVSHRYCAWVSRALDGEAILRYLGRDEYIYRWQERYALLAQSAGYDAGAEVFNLRSAFLVEKDLDGLMCEDGIHPNTNGQELIRREVVRRFFA